MDKIEKLNNDSLFMSELEAMKWQEKKEKCLREDGINEGYALGLEQKTKEIVLSMVNNKLPIDTISKVTNKTASEINEIIKEN